jgi:hypothetical protein
MSALTSMAGTARDSKPALAKEPAKPGRQRHTPGGAGLGKEASQEARRLAAAVLEVLAGARTPSQAAEALSVSLPRYFQLESRAMRALLAGCEARPRGHRRSAEKEVNVLRRQQERLERELSRQQSLVRLAQRTIGLAPVKVEAGKPQSKKRRRRPVVRALRAAVHLHKQSQEQATPAATAPANKEETT